MIRRTALFIPLAMFGVLHGAAAQDTRGGSNQALTSDQIRTIQFVGRSVLGAKHSYVEDADQARLRDQVTDLRKSLAGLERVDNRAHVTLDARKGQGSRRDDDDLDDDAPKVKALRAMAQTMRAQRQRLQQKVDQTRDRHPNRELAEAAIGKVAELEDKLQEALQAPRESRRGRLNQLRELLDTSPLKAAPVSETPSISTLARHRN